MCSIARYLLRQLRLRLERNGILQIPRLAEAAALNEEIQTNSLPQFNAELFGRGPPLAMTIAKPGLLDSLLFIEDTVYPQPLSADEW